jgi:hypothetical protein
MKATMKQKKSFEHIEANLLNSIIRFNDAVDKCFDTEIAEFIKKLLEAYINKDKILYND